MAATVPTASSVDMSSEWPESYVKNGYSEQRGGDDILFTITPEGHYLASLNGYAVIPIEEYFALINEPLPEKIVQALGLQPSARHSRSDEPSRESPQVPVWIHPRDMHRSRGDRPVPCRDSELHRRLSDRQDTQGSGSQRDSDR